MSAAIEALYIYDEHNTLLISHVYTGRPPPPSTLLPLYLGHPSPRPSLLYLPALTPPSTCFSIIQDNLLFLSPSSNGASDPLLVLEFLHRVSDALQEFLGSPLLATKITASYDIVAQILAEITDAGLIAQTEANALRDAVETGPGVLKNLLGTLGAAAAGTSLPGSGSGGLAGGASSASSLSNSLCPQLGIQPQQPAAVSAIPWRRANVRHTHNELYVDMLESLSLLLAPSGRVLSAFARGSIIFTCKVSGVPDLVLALAPGKYGGGMGTGVGGKGEQLRRLMQRAVFHPCVRLNRWKGEGVLSFVPPDGRFVLAGYEVDLLGGEMSFSTTAASITAASLNLPATLDVTTGLGTNGTEFEVRIISTTSSAAGGPSRSAAAMSLQSHLTSKSTSLTNTSTTSDVTSPPLEDICVRIPLPATRVRNVADLRPSRGEAHWEAAEGAVEWRVGAKEWAAAGGTAVLRCSVQGVESEGDDVEDVGAGSGLMTTTTYDYDDNDDGGGGDVRYGHEYDYDEDEGSGAYQSQPRSRTQAPSKRVQSSTNGNTAFTRQSRIASNSNNNNSNNKSLMPTSATLSFTLKGSLPSGLRVESLLLDTKKSRGLAADVKPYKGVKYLTVSEGGVEVRC